jgi:hypothetical protein
MSLDGAADEAGLKESSKEHDSCLDTGGSDHENGIVFYHSVSRQESKGEVVDCFDV